MADKYERIKVNLETGEGLIIERETLLSKVHHAGNISWSICSWIVWMLLVRPLLLGVLWYLGYRTAAFQMYYLEGIKNVDFFTQYSAVILVIFFIIFGWNRYNGYRFRGKERRKPRGECGSEELAKYYKIKTDDADVLKNSNVDIYFEKDDTIVLKTDSGKEIKALYAPQNLKKHFSDSSDGGV